MRTIDIVFTKSKKKIPIGSWSIMAWTGKDYSHVSRRKIIYTEKMYYQASEGKVNYENARVFDQKHEIVREYTIEVPVDLERQMGIACLHDAGQPYASLQNLGIVLVDIMKLFGKKIENPWKRGRNCSELLYVNVLKPMFPDLDYDPNTIKPHHIEEILIMKGYKPINN